MDYTDLKRRLNALGPLSPATPKDVLAAIREAAAAIVALEAERDALRALEADVAVLSKALWQVSSREVAALVQQPAADVAQENPRNPPMQG